VRGVFLQHAVLGRRHLTTASWFEEFMAVHPAGRPGQGPTAQASETTTGATGNQSAGLT